MQTENSNRNLSKKCKLKIVNRKLSQKHILIMQTENSDRNLWQK